MNAQTTKQAEQLASKIGKVWKVFLIILFGLISAGIVFLLITGFITARDWVGDRNFLWRSPIEIKVQTPLQIVERRSRVLLDVQKSLESSPTAIKKVSAQEVSGSNVNGVITAGESLDEKIERAYKTIRLHESGNGTNKSGLHGYCLSKGMVNSVGYAPSENYCFKDEVEEKETVILWFNNRLSGKKSPHCKTVEECLSVYNSSSYTL